MSSPDALHGLLGTNAVPDATQIRFIMHSVQNLREALQPIGNDTLVLGTAVSQIHREMTALDAMLKKSQAVFMGPTERFHLLTDIDFRPVINPFFTTHLRPDIRLIRLDFSYSVSNNNGEMQVSLSLQLTSSSSLFHRQIHILSLLILVCDTRWWILISSFIPIASQTATRLSKYRLSMTAPVIDSLN